MFVEIRPANLNDSKELFELIIKNREYLSRWLPWPDQTKSQEDTEKFIKIVNDMQIAKRAIFCLVVFQKKVVGVVGANIVSNNDRKAIYNYWIDYNFSRNNIATIAMKKLIIYLQDSWKIGIHEIHICTENIASIKVAKKLNFNLIGVLENAEILNGKEINNYVFRNRKNNTNSRR